MFERFYKEDRSRGMNTRGSGLGLHICKILVNLSGGQIHAESEEGNWCRFVFTLPDCTGQEFTNWFYLFRRRGHWFAYHSVSRDV